MNREIRKLAKRLKDKDPVIRRAAVRRLADVGGEKAELLLIKALGDENPQVRMLAARSLGRLRSKRAVPDLILALKDINYHVRATVAEALGQIGDNTALPYLAELLPEEDSELLRSVTRAMSLLLSSDEPPSEEIKWIADRMEQLSLSSDPVIQAAAIESLGKLRVSDLAPRFLQILEGEEPYVMGAALKALADFGDKRVVSYAIKAIESGDLIEEAVEALARIGDKRAVPTLISLLSDSKADPIHRGKAAWALKKLRAEESTEALARVLFGVGEGNFRRTDIFDPRFQYLREQVTLALMELDLEMLHDLLEEGVKSPDGWIRMLTVDIMRLVDTPRSRMLLMEALEDPIPGIRETAELELRRRAAEES